MFVWADTGLLTTDRHTRESYVSKNLKRMCRGLGRRRKIIIHWPVAFVSCLISAGPETVLHEEDFVLLLGRKIPAFVSRDTNKTNTVTLQPVAQCFVTSCVWGNPHSTWQHCTRFHSTIQLYTSDGSVAPNLMSHFYSNEHCKYSTYGGRVRFEVFMATRLGLWCRVNS